MAQLKVEGWDSRCCAWMDPAAGGATAALAGPAGDLSRAFAAAAAAASPEPRSRGSSRPRRAASTSPAGPDGSGGGPAGDAADTAGAVSAKAGGGIPSGSVDSHSTPLACAHALCGTRAGTGSAAAADTAAAGLPPGDAAAGDSAAGLLEPPAAPADCVGAPPACGGSAGSVMGPAAIDDAGDDGKLSADAVGADAALCSAVLWGRGATAEVGQPVQTSCFGVA
jgi:hypothetical protein